ncbi:MAG: Fic family protein [Nocardioidaceae bacterium]
MSFTQISQIHEVAMTPVWQVAPHPEATEREGPGRFREHEIAAFDGGMKPPAWPLVPAMMRDWVDAVNAKSDVLARKQTTSTPLPELLAAIHDGFEVVHPFIDGNGRTGQLVLNLILVRLGYPPVIVLKTQRSSYLAAMQKSDGGDHGPLGEILARAMYDNLNRFIVPGVAGPARLVPLAALADQAFSVAALRQAAARGRLDAVQGSDGIWRSSRKAVADYASTKGRHTSRGER